MHDSIMTREIAGFWRTIFEGRVRFARSAGTNWLPSCGKDQLSAYTCSYGRSSTPKLVEARGLPAQELMQVAPLFAAVEIADATPSTEEHRS